MIDQDTIFLLSSEGQLDEIPHRPYQTEDLLQELIDRHPELLVGEQIDRDDPPRWLMVQREAGIPDSEGGCDRWSIDHVLLDQHGRPTLVEVKRSTDTRIRREVVGQMLDYAANALKYWPKDRIRELAANQCGGLENLETRLLDLLKDPQADIEAFWQIVDRNLREGEMRLLFVADLIPTELRRIIEFLNEHMPRVEVLGVEIRQYERAGTRVLVPRVVGQTESARQDKTRRTVSKPLTEQQFFERLDENASKSYRLLLSLAERYGYEVRWNATGFVLRPSALDGSRGSLIYGYPQDPYSDKKTRIQIYLKDFHDDAAKDSLRDFIQLEFGGQPGGQHTVWIQLLDLPIGDEEGSLKSLLNQVRDAFVRSQKMLPPE